jgi:hypothetical protein
MSKKFLENLVIFISIITVNFASYLLMFDFHTLILVDSVSISNYIFQMLILLTLISSAVTLLSKYIFNFLLILPTYIKNKDNKTLILWLDKVEIFFNDKLFKIIIIVILFTYFFTGFLQMIIISIVITLISSVWFYIEKDYLNIKKSTKSVNLTSGKKQMKLKEFIINNIGILLILLSFMIGNSRSYYVKDNINININDNTKEYALYLTTSTGIGIYDNELEQTLFISWDNVKSMKFLK